MKKRCLFLEVLISQAPPKGRLPLLRRLAFSQIKAGYYKNAENTLKDLLATAPGDRLAERWLSGLEEARNSGSYDEAAEMIRGFGGLAEEGLELTLLAHNAIETCSFEGMDSAKLQSVI